jgi:CRP/FNR family transcriptional regulator
MEALIDLLGGSLLFGGLDREQLQAILRIAVPQKYQREEMIFAEGDAGRGFFILVEGMIKIFKLAPEGKEQILHIFGPGEPFGEIPVFTGQPFPANAQALAASRALFFPRQRFVALISGNPSLSLNMLALLCLRLRQFTIQVENLSLREVPARLAAYLRLAREEQRQAQRVTLPFSKGQLASLLGTIPETLSRIFARMSAQGLIAVNGREIAILDDRGLAEMALQGRGSEKNG